MSRGRSPPRLDLEVSVYGACVGRLHRDRAGLTRFTPDRHWLEAGQRPPLGLAFLGQPGPRSAGTGLPSWFENLLPDPGSALRQRLCLHLGLRETDSAALLCALGHDLPGAVQVRGEPGQVACKEPESVPDGRLRFSLAGMQLKLSMLRSDSRFALPARGETGRWIVKIPGDRLPELPEVEDATMSWAQLSGIRVPDHQVMPAEALQGVDPGLIGSPRTVFVIERFDRKADGSRVHQEDFAQALEVLPADKYGKTGPRRIGYDGLARLVLDACGSDAQGEFVDRLAFIVAAGNDDAHLKNWSFQWGHERRPWLSPSYDLVSTVSWPEFGWQQPGGPMLALGLGRVGRFADLDREAVARFSERGKILDGVARFFGALERARAAWSQVADRAPERMRDAVREHWERVPVLKALGPLSP